MRPMQDIAKIIGEIFPEIADTKKAAGAIQDALGEERTWDWKYELKNCRNYWEARSGASRRNWSLCAQNWARSAAAKGTTRPVPTRTTDRRALDREDIRTVSYPDLQRSYDKAENMYYKSKADFELAAKTTPRSSMIPLEPVMHFVLARMALIQREVLAKEYQRRRKLDPGPSDRPDPELPL